MRIREYAKRTVKRPKIGTRLLDDRRYRVIAKAVLRLVFHLLYAFYNGILGVLSSSLIFAAFSVYYFLLAAMRFCAVFLDRKAKMQNGRQISAVTGVMLIALSVILHIMVLISMREQTAALYGTITMITIATFTFTKITAAIITAIKHKKDRSGLYGAVNAIRYSEIAVSLLTMQQSMLVSFGDGTDDSAIILNACTGAGVCFFILILGIITLKNGRKENAKWQNPKFQEQSKKSPKR